MLLRRTAALAAALTALTALGTAPAPAAQDDVDLGVPRAAAHAHNDYEHDRPLYDALGHGFTSVEADVWLVDGELLVAHDREDVRAGATLESLYLEPLDALVKGHGGSVYPGWEGEFQLLIDIKSEGPATYAAIEEELAEHRTMLTRYTHGKTKPGAVTAVISGNRPLSVMSAAEQRFGFYDGRAADLGGALPAELMPLISNNWQQLFSWQGAGAMPAAEREKLTAYVAAAHAQGARVRFWATPDLPGPAREAVWAELLTAGVDHINTDDLAALERFLAGRE
ncbi:phosphatidylinositol-specific phospholipase C/glycerophosphodiester phosphodiesterase family protein [Arthrobacter zhaoguopingii]|uniref:phosphatidylinositol-specific phospholipase C/glycerophosphodiester phosphodiesterase family protein n=1 Tax=Arthrobacter zhaoguopingii TaxID=2681491 RepID=UPI00135C20DE|nr:phosphatidylinositol-specific phospholipase C/glycerophosphodiester phosphodiesterase family protein [Arthrobacter zhaoguopingii]